VKVITFRSPTNREFQAFVDYFIPDYAAEIVSNYRLPEEDALVQARRELEASFPDAEKTSDQILLCIILSATSGTSRIRSYTPPSLTTSIFSRRSAGKVLVARP